LYWIPFIYPVVDQICSFAPPPKKIKKNKSQFKTKTKLRLKTKDARGNSSHGEGVETLFPKGGVRFVKIPKIDELYEEQRYFLRKTRYFRWMG